MNPDLNTLQLISYGGDVQEAIGIGHLVRKNLLVTETAFRTLPGVSPMLVPYDKSSASCTGSSCVCASACFLIWSAGISRIGDALIVHRPHDTTGTFGSKTPEEAQAIYNTYLDQMRNYLISMEVPPKYIQLMIDTPSNDQTLLNKDDVEKNLQGYPISISEWILASCNRLTYSEFSELQNLLEVNLDSKLSKNDQNRLNYLNQRLNDDSICAAKKIRDARSSLHH